MDIKLARAIPFLRDLTDDELNLLASLLTLRECQQGERILEEGMVPTEFCIVCEGVVHVRRRANTREMLLARIGPGGFFGEVNLFDPGIATASISAKTKTLIAVISYERFLTYMDEHPRAGYKIASALLAETSRRMRDASSRLANAVFWSERRPAAPATEVAPAIASVST